MSDKSLSFAVRSAEIMIFIMFIISSLVNFSRTHAEVDRIEIKRGLIVSEPLDDTALFVHLEGLHRPTVIKCKNANQFNIHDSVTSSITFYKPLLEIKK